MATITLSVPDDLAQKLQQVDQNMFMEALRKVLDSPQITASQNPLLPEANFQISKEEWKKRLLRISAWSDEEVAEIERAREYLNQWQPRRLF
ncbi:MAG: hypothetical protein DPW09_20860 [Anaerolineae bacterium]|nr:hypothetical protein [Anaerolineales bacterium]MCQ3975894.1 hypothetical protein [Anaerolineae bacterium]